MSILHELLVSGKLEANTVVYRVGECMQELMKLWKEYESSQADKTGENSQYSPTLEIRIPAEHVTATNRQVRSKYIINLSCFLGNKGFFCLVALVFIYFGVLEENSVTCGMHACILDMWAVFCEQNTLTFTC